MLRWQSIGFAATILVIAGCEGTEARFEETARGPDTAAAPPAAELPATREMPKVIEKAEDLSQDVQSDIGDGDWDDAAEKTRELRALSDSLKQTGAATAEVTAYDSAVAKLAQNVESRDRVEAGLAANDANRAVLAMMATYSPKVPVEVGYMEAATRDVVYHAEGADWSAAEKAIKDLNSNYSSVQAHIARQDSSLNADIKTNIEQLDAAVTQKNVAAVRDAAEKVMDDVDEVEDKY